MASGNIDIEHPKKHEKINTSDFPASGKTEGDVGHITGVLKNDKDDILYTGKTLLDGREWVISFEGVIKGDYTLEVKGVGASVAKRPFSVAPTHAIGIASPVPGATLGNAFLAYGSSDQAYAVSGQIMNSQNGVYFGTTLQGPPATQSWIIQFRGVPGGNPYTLTVSDTEGFGFNANNLIITPR